MYGVFHHLWTCFTIYDGLLGGFSQVPWARKSCAAKAGAWHLQNCAEGHGGPLLFGGGRDLRRACCGNDIVVHQLKSNHPDISWLYYILYTYICIKIYYYIYIYTLLDIYIYIIYTWHYYVVSPAIMTNDTICTVLLGFETLSATWRLARSQQDLTWHEQHWAAKMLAKHGQYGSALVWRIRD